MNFIRQSLSSTIPKLIKPSILQVSLPLNITRNLVTNTLFKTQTSSNVLLGMKNMINPERLLPASSCIQQQPIRCKQTKARKLHPSLRDGDDNGGLLYGRDVMEAHRRGPFRQERVFKNPLGPYKPFAKGIVLKTLVKKPKKPNSANRKCVLVRIPGGKELTAYVPGEGHNLQEHNQVFVKVARLRDTPGVKIKCVRGRYDLPHVIKKTK